MGRPASRTEAPRPARTVAVAFAGGLALQALLAASAAAQTHTAIQTVTKPQIAAIAQSKAERTPAERKMASQILDALAADNTGRVNAAAPGIRPPRLPRSPEGVRVVIRTNGADAAGLMDAIRAEGQVMRQDPGEVTAIVPLARLPDLAARDEVLTIRLLRSPALNRTGPIAREGALSHAVDAQLTQDYGVTGRGVSVCVLSDSLDDASGALLTDSVAAGAIDRAKLKTLEGQEGWGSGEGLAMLEIVHAIAPDADLWFATGFTGPNQMAANIRALADQTCHIIVDDVTYPDESPFQDGPISRAVQDVSDRGVLYFSSAGNSGNHYHLTSGVWEGDFADGGPAGPQFGGTGRIHMWKPGITLNTVDEAEGEATVDVFWSDSLGQASNSYDIYVVNNRGEVVQKSDTSLVPGADPYQYVEHVRQGDSVVLVKHGNAEPRYLHVSVGKSRIRHSTPGSVRGHNASGAKNAFSVAAKGATSGGAPFAGGSRETVRPFSSDGPRRMFYDGQGRPFTPGVLTSAGGMLVRKPDFTAADGVSTSLPAGPLNPFIGTSAAAPHAAAIAALLLSCAPRPTAEQVRETLQTTALVLGGVQSDAAGYGVIMARPSVEKLCRRVAATDSAALPGPAAPRSAP